MSLVARGLAAAGRSWDAQCCWEFKPSVSLQCLLQLVCMESQRDVVIAGKGHTQQQHPTCRTRSPTH